MNLYLLWSVVLGVTIPVILGFVLAWADWW